MNAGLDGAPIHLVPVVVWPALVAAYREPPRRYHTLAHAAFVATVAEELGGDRPCLLAAWGHDVVYEAMAVDNERRSAAWMARALGADPDTAEVARLIELTAGHDPAAGDWRGEVLCDADLQVLAGAAEEYAAYRSAVREEYDHLDQRAWRTGRAAVIRGLLDRDSIFRTERGRRVWEAPARANLAAELAQLDG